MASQNPTKKSIEKRALLALENHLIDSEVISAYLSENDKEPMWDGHLYLYKGEKDKNDNFVCRVATQVKGKSVKVFKTDNYSFQIEMNCISAYQRVGTAYFVVQIKDSETRIFYRLITPMLAANIIRAHKGQKTASVKMDALPSNLGTLEEELLQFDIDCKNQISFAGRPPFRFEDLKRRGVNKFSFNLPLLTKIDSLYRNLTRKPHYLYADLGDGIQVPVGDEPMWFKMYQNRDDNVSVNGRVFYNSVGSELERDTVTLTIGGGMTIVITVDEDMKPLKVTLNFKRTSKNLKDIIHDAEFVLAVYEVQGMTIGDRWLDLRIPFCEYLEEMQKHLDSWKRIDGVLEKFGVNFDLDMSKLTKKDSETLKVMIASVEQNEPMNITNVVEGINRVDLANLVIWILVNKDESGKCIINNLFDKNLGIVASYKYPDGEYKESFYSRFERDWLAECDNFPYDDIIPSFEKMKKSPHCYERANLFLLELIAAYDMVDNDSPKKQIMFDKAMELTEWLLEKDKGKDGQLANTINKYQLLKRKPGLSEKNIEALKLLHLEHQTDNPAQCGIALLLDDMTTFEYYWGKLSEDEKKMFETYPLIRFRK